MDLRTMAVSRLMLDNFDHIKAYWIMLGIGTAQTALAYGADDLDGTVRHELIYHDAGADHARGALGRRNPPADRRSRPRAGRARHALSPRDPRRDDVGKSRSYSNRAKRTSRLRRLGGMVELSPRRPSRAIFRSAPAPSAAAALVFGLDANPDRPRPARASRRASSSTAASRTQIGDPQRRQAVLPRAEQIARTAQREIDLGQLETVGRGDERLQPLARFVGLRRRRTRSKSRETCRG